MIHGKLKGKELERCLRDENRVSTQEVTKTRKGEYEFVKVSERSDGKVEEWESGWLRLMWMKVIFI